MYAFATNKSLDQLLDTSPKYFHFLFITFNYEFSDSEVWSANQNSRLLEIGEKKKITLVIN